MKPRLLILFALLPLLVAAAPPTSQDDPEPGYRTRRYNSPRAVFEAYVKAGEKKDYKTALDCLTPDAQKDVAAFTAYLFLSIKSFNPDEAKKTFKPIYDVMDKHGLTEKATSDVKFEGNPLKLPEAARVALRKLIKKPEAFMIDMARASEKMQKDGLVPAQGKTKTTLKDLKIDGNKATATMVTENGNGAGATKQKVEFVKSHAGWKMIPSQEYESDLPPPPPPPVNKDK